MAVARIPRKNVIEFCGKPMIAWSIEASLACGCFDRIIVSTDCSEIADIATDFGAEVPFMRPIELADDFSGTMPVVAHAVQWYQGLGNVIEAVCCLYATAPFVDPLDLQRGLTFSQSADDRFVFTATGYIASSTRTSSRPSVWPSTYVAA